MPWFFFQICVNPKNSFRHLGAPVLIYFMKASQKELTWEKAVNCSVWAALNLFQVADKPYRECIPGKYLAQLRGNGNI